MTILSREQNEKMKILNKREMREISGKSLRAELVGGMSLAAGTQCSVEVSSPTPLDKSMISGVIRQST